MECVADYHRSREAIKADQGLQVHQIFYTQNKNSMGISFRTIQVVMKWSMQNVAQM